MTAKRTTAFRQPGFTPALSAVVISLALGSFVPTHAALIVPDAIYSVQVSGDQFRISLPVPAESSIDQQSFDDFKGLTVQSIATARTSGGSDPQADVIGHLSWSVTMPDRLSSLDALNLFAEARVEYYVAVAPLSGDPDDHTPVPLVVTVRGHADADGPHPTGGGNTTVSFALSMAPGINQMANAPVGFSGYDATIKTFIVPNIAYQVFLRSRGTVSIGLTEFNSGTAEFQAVADPLIVIDPEFELRDQYELVFSSNLVPLPGAAWFFLTALAAAASRMRLRSRDST